MAQQSSDQKKSFPLIPKIINGGIAGIIGVSCVFPLDLVKTRLQNQPIGPNGEKMYSSMLDCFKKTMKAEGYLGMYRGSAVNIILITPEKAIKLTGNDYFRYFLTAEDGSLSIPRQMLAGAAAGLCQIVITTPMELLKIQMQDAGRVAAEAKAKGQVVEKVTATQIATKLVKENGILGLYKGIGATMVRDVTFSVIYFPLFATLNDLGPRKSPGSSEAIFYWSFISGLLSGSFSALAVTPLDVIKTRMQAVTSDSGSRAYSSVGDAATKILKEEGAKAFFKGGACRVMVVAPMFGIAQMVYFLGIAERLLGV